MRCNKNKLARPLLVRTAPALFPALLPALLPVLLLGAVTLAGLPRSASAAPPAAASWGSYDTPFSADSPWNARPVEPVLGSYQIPKSDYYPSIGGGAYSTGVFLASASDGPVEVHGLPGKPGVWDPDSESNRIVTVPRWPAGVVPATGRDGHADIVDPVAGVIHSFWLLKQQDGVWVAAQYAWTPLKGRGWGDPAHYFQGARAAGVPTSGGIIRKKEATDSEPLFHHALAMSLTYNALAAEPNYIFPATSGDNKAGTPNTGQIPEGALLMLPASFDTRQIASPAVRKVAETLKTYGGYVVDRNQGTPYVIYVENGADFKLDNSKGWNNDTARAVDLIRANLRQVVSQKGWLDGNGKRFTPRRSLNLLSMRGPWQGQNGPAAGQYDTLTQAVVFPAGTPRVTMLNTKGTGNGIGKVRWAPPAAGSTCRLTAQAEGGAKLRLQILAPGGATSFDSGELGDRTSKTLPCPNKDAYMLVYAISGGGPGASSVRGELLDNAK